MSPVPRMAYADASGQVYDHPTLKMAVWDGFRIREPEAEELVPLPPGSDMMLLPGRLPLGFSEPGDRLVEFAGDREGEVVAVSAFLAPAWTRLCHPAYRTLPGAKVLPLFAYAGLGWADGRFWTTALRIDPDRRQDPELFDLARVRGGVERDLKAMPGNRLLQQLRRCALDYRCRAAQNFFLRRWECPLPTAQACNARCVGCISYQEGEIPPTQERIGFTPAAEEIAEVTRVHFGRVERPIASFGQGCEGEPLVRADVLLRAVQLVRERGPAGTVNLNSNASRPEAVAELCAAGLSSVRVSMASPAREIYDRYHQPQGYSFDDVIESIRRAKAAGRFVSLNLFVFPGVTDRPEEVAALKALLAEHRIDMIQWRNLNIDPEYGMEKMGGGEAGLGLRRTIEEIRSAFPGLRHGYFNPFLG